MSNSDSDVLFVLLLISISLSLSESQEKVCEVRTSEGHLLAGVACYRLSE